MRVNQEVDANAGEEGGKKWGRVIAGELGEVHRRCIAFAIIFDCFVAPAGQEHTEDLTCGQVL